MVSSPSCPKCNYWNKMSRLYKREVTTEEYLKTKRKFVPIGWQHNGGTYSSGCGRIFLDQDLKDPEKPGLRWKTYFESQEKKEE